MSRAAESSRRGFLRGVVSLAAIAGAAAGCRQAPAPLSCLDSQMLAGGDAQVRTALGYTEPAPDLKRSCGSCQQYVAAAAAGGCGSCRLLKGSIHPNGTCKAFSAKST